MDLIPIRHLVGCLMNQDNALTCDHSGSLEFIETSLMMADMTMETVAICKKCKKQIIIKGEKFTPIKDIVLRK